MICVLCNRSQSPEYAVDESDKGSGPPERVALQPDEQRHQPAGARALAQQTDAQHSDAPQHQRQQPQGGRQCEYSTPDPTFGQHPSH